VRRVLVGFWALYFGLIALTNALDGLRAMSFLPAGWRFRSGNWALLVSTVGDGRVAWVLFGGVILWEAWAAWLFWQALRAGMPGHRAFVTATALWAAFLIADELFLRYDLEAVHLRLLTAQAITWMAASWAVDVERR
jgi:hypothetical protein